jgi:hypothetical protein
MGDRKDDPSALSEDAVRDEANERSRLEGAIALLEHRTKVLKELGLAHEAFNVQEEIAHLTRKKEIKDISDLTRYLTEAQQDLATARLAADTAAIDAAKERIAVIEEEIESQATLNAEYEERKKKIGELRGGYEALFSFFTQEPQKGGIVDSLFNPGKAKEAFTQMRSKTTGMNVMKNVMNGVVQSSIAMAVAQDNATVAFNKATGVAGDYNAEIRQVSSNLVSTGVSSADVGAAFGDLYKNVSDFTFATREQQKSLTTTTALLNKLGVSSAAVTKNIQFATKSLGMNLEGAAALQTGLRNLANELGLSAEQVAQDFGVASNVLAAFGDGAIESFALLEAQSKATGLSMQKLISIVEKFDTFDSAAGQVGKLNAMLGGPFLSTLEMIEETNPAERMRLLAGALTDAGLSFDQMSYYERKAIADAAGLQDVNDLALLLSGNLESIGAPQMDAESIIEMKAQTTAFNTVMDELNQTMMSLAISVGPLISALKFVMDGAQVALSPLRMLSDVIEEIFIGTDALTGSTNELAIILKTVLGTAALVGGAFLLISSPAWATAAAIGAVVSGVIGLAHALTVGNSPSLLESLNMSTDSFGTLSVEAELANTELNAATVNTKALATEGLVSATAGTEAAKQLMNTTTQTNNTVNNSWADTAKNAVRQLLPGGAPAAQPPINLSLTLSIDGDEIKNAVNKVKVDPSRNPNLYNSVVKLVNSGQEKV